MKSRGAPAGFFLTLVASISAFSQTPPEERPQFRVSVDTVSLAITVVDDRGRHRNGLGAETFAVYEDGVEQRIEFFARGELPLRMVILLDTSGSMREKIEMAQEAAVQFVRSMKPGDHIKVVEFNERVLTLAEFTTDFDLVEEAIRKTAPSGATSLYNALYVSLKDLEKDTKEEVDRRAIVVLSDGADTKSVLGFEDVKEQARKSNVVVYAISLRATEYDLTKDKYRNAKFELDVLARESGGKSYAPEKIGDLAGVYDEIATELKSQYSLGYVSTNTARDGSWRRLQIVSREPGTEIRARTGYYAPRPPRRPRRSLSN